MSTAVEQVGGAIGPYPKKPGGGGDIKKEYCGRCESVGHGVESCPFPDDEPTRQLAARRRALRLHPPPPRPAAEPDDEPLPPTGMTDADMRELLARLSGGRWLNRTLTRRQRLLRELAYCRMKLCRARAGQGEMWVAFYAEECARLRRCIDAKPRTSGVVVYPEIRAEVRSWLMLDEWRRMPW